MPAIEGLAGGGRAGLGRHLLGRGRAGGARRRARPRSTTSAAARRRCSSWSPRPAAATCSCTSRDRRGSTARRRDYDDVVEHLKALVRGESRAWPAALGSPRSRSRSTPDSTSTSPPTQDLEILRRLAELRELGLPLYVSLSRKDFLGAIVAGSWEERLPAGEREWGTVAATPLAVRGGADMLRIHDRSRCRRCGSPARDRRGTRASIARLSSTRRR